jgi:hypothetical protein
MMIFCGACARAGTRSAHGEAGMVSKANAPSDPLESRPTCLTLFHFQLLLNPRAKAVTTQPIENRSRDLGEAIVTVGLAGYAIGIRANLI